MNHRNICRIINKWDPIDLIEITPQDEYSSEIKEIIGRIENATNIQVEDLSSIIYDVFCKNFDQLFIKSKQECLIVASKILEDKRE